MASISISLRLRESEKLMIEGFSIRVPWLIVKKEAAGRCFGAWLIFLHQSTQLRYSLFDNIHLCLDFLYRYNHCHNSLSFEDSL